MKEIFLNSVKCMYRAYAQIDVLETLGIINQEFVDHIFYDEHIGEYAYENIIKCLNLKESEGVKELNEHSIVYEDEFGNRYDVDKLFNLFEVKHEDICSVKQCKINHNENKNNRD